MIGFSRRQWEKAESLLLKTENSPSAPVYRRWLAEIAEGRGETAKALSYWRLVINPDFNEKTPELTSRSELENNLYALQRIISIHSKSDPSEGRMVKDKIEQSLSGDLTLSYMLAYEAQDAGEDDRALATFRDLAKLEKNDEKILFFGTSISRI